jgi:hypothetical protein
MRINIENELLPPKEFVFEPLFEFALAFALAFAPRFEVPFDARFILIQSNIKEFAIRVLSLLNIKIGHIVLF